LGQAAGRTATITPGNPRPRKAGSDPCDAKSLLTASLRDTHPVRFIKHKVLCSSSGSVPEDEYLVPLVKAEANREGLDVTPISPFLMLHKTFSPAERLAGDGLDA